MTGGSGPVGLALIQKLLAEHIEILLFQRRNSKRSQYLPENKLLHREYCSLEDLKKFDSLEKGFDVFFHLGWSNTKRELRDQVDKQYENVPYSCDAVEVAHKLGCHTFVGIGSQAEYGRKQEPLTGDLFCEPETAYGVSKLCACYMTRILCERYGMHHIWTRILSGYGMYDNPNSMLISNILNSLNGRPLQFSKGEQIWDFTYMDDIANALFLVAKKGKNSEIYPIGSGAARPLKQYIEILCDKLGHDRNTEIERLPYTEKQVMHLEADISKLREDTGWMPSMPFEKGIEKVIAFYREWERE